MTRGNPIGRLDYSLWAEGANHLIREVVTEPKKKPRIEDDRDLTFFVAQAALEEPS